MKHCLLGGAFVLAFVGVAYASPLTPSINGPDINFGAEFVYQTNGVNPDSLITSKEGQGEEATAYWPNWPSTAGVQPIWFTPGAGGAVFGGDVQLSVLFNAHDETPPPLDVSLTGTGGKVGADLEIYGTLTMGQPNVLLWAIDFDQTATPNVPGSVSLYGYADSPSYVFEGVGLIVGGELAGQNLDKTGVIRGNIDLVEFVGFPSRYDPASDVTHQVNGSYSGETGAGFAIPEPATVGLLILGGLVGLLGRRARR